MTNQDYSSNDLMPIDEASPGFHDGKMTNDQRIELDRLISAAYDEFRRLAILLKRSGINPAVSTGTLVNETWLRLAGAGKFEVESKQHFMNIAAQAMRHVLIETARRKNTFKRGEGILSSPVAFDADSFSITCDEDLLALDEALKELELLDPQMARIVVEKFFGGFEMAEIAEMLKISVATVNRGWRAARARLAIALHSRR